MFIFNRFSAALTVDCARADDLQGMNECRAEALYHGIELILDLGANLKNKKQTLRELFRKDSSMKNTDVF